MMLAGIFPGYCQATSGTWKEESWFNEATETAIFAGRERWGKINSMWFLPFANSGAI